MSKDETAAAREALQHHVRQELRNQLNGMLRNADLGHVEELIIETTATPIPGIDGSAQYQFKVDTKFTWKP